MLSKCKRLQLENKQKAAHNAVNKNTQKSNIADCSASDQQTTGTSNIPVVVHQIYNRTGSDHNINIHINNQEPPILNKRQSQSSYPSVQDSFKQSSNKTSHCVPTTVQAAGYAVHVGEEEIMLRNPPSPSISINTRNVPGTVYNYSLSQDEEGESADITKGSNSQNQSTV